MKHNDGLRLRSLERRKRRRVNGNYNESPFSLILDIESRLRKMNKVDSQAFLEMLRTLVRIRIPKQGNARRLSRYLE
jgi:hypothetical protein